MGMSLLLHKKTKPIIGILTFITMFAVVHSSSGHAEENVETIYQKNCATCHGENLSGGMADSFLNDEWLKDGTADSLAYYIKKGASTRGMPSWEGTLTEDQIRSLVIYIKEQRYTLLREAKKPDNKSKTITSLGHTFNIGTIHTAESILWAVEYLPDGSMLVTQRDGELLNISADGKSSVKIKDFPEVWHHVQGGLLDITLHPDYANNGWIYVAYAATKDGKKGATKIARGKLKDGRWVEHQDIFEAPDSAYSGSGRHFGSRIVFSEGYVYFGFGERGDRETAQNMTTSNGKIFRLHDDGRVPKDNPFVNYENALPGIWSLGHRNPQGMVVEPNTNRIWEAEHGPRGGDEINIIKRGANYGWPVITYGMNYDGTPITHLTEKDGMQQPKHYWVPSIAVAGITFYDGNMFTKWKGKMLAGGMGVQELQLLSTNEEMIDKVDVILSDRGRIRDVSVAPDGAIMLVVTIDGKGHILRLSI
ncbi:PQQ-dependent sugar dehydrogenase [Gilvimarinus agarilyticus]|uniref:PQQ-dependent sugar dehydrogenase n=1 Tax=Gilvimarinus sp. 2_MG-2023 TaxID=3062666 RepID=UPI001C09565F|nr:PQQ-dependent sugar dehydrogenase [Gilvimarinus sp. 2_MG-2023]MBU2887718.1 PQQ-dependent sugar dehydrogenase [Gilvimarinus agarilyticus]MDO6572365.1 PQQ-dependent sugar dehydrogenase [Gilvimarinus sp. 2_MG-2023]